MGVFNLGTVSGGAAGASGMAQLSDSQLGHTREPAEQLRCRCSARLTAQSAPGVPAPALGAAPAPGRRGTQPAGPGSASSCGPCRREGGLWGHGRGRPTAEGEQGGEGVPRESPDPQQRAQTQVPPSTRRPGCREPMEAQRPAPRCPNRTVGLGWPRGRRRRAPGRDLARSGRRLGSWLPAGSGCPAMFWGAP